MHPTDIPGYERFAKVEPITKGMAGDTKYYIEAMDGRKCLLRVADAGEYERRKAEYDTMRQAWALGVPMPEPLDFGFCHGGLSVYTLIEWVDGKEAIALLPALSETEQYLLGKQSGEALRLIHQIPAPPGMPDWAERYFGVMDERFAAYRREGIPFEGHDRILAYLDSHRDGLKARPQCHLHGDFHTGNMIVSDEGKLHIIDWHFVDFDSAGDPWSELTCVETAYPAFSSGQINGYFGGEPPQAFWPLFAYYVAASALASIVWAKYFAPDALQSKIALNEHVLRWFDGMKNPVPTWYLKDFYIQYIDGVPLKLKAPFDLSFMAKYGKVFKVFDDQDSGNLCFGTEKMGKRYFVKFAGAPTARYNGNIADAIARLKPIAPIYRDLEHPHLIRYISAEEIGGGYAVVFEWVDAVGIGRMYPLAHKRFAALPLQARMKVFDDILAFHDHVTQRGYVAIDFYDGTILYDFDTGETVICDIDFYQKAPYYGDMGIWGSSKFVSPEECVIGERMDEITTVYTMGATAFALLSEFDRSPEAWELGDIAYAVVKKATSDHRAARQQSMRQFIEEWAAAQSKHARKPSP